MKVSDDVYVKQVCDWVDVLSRKLTSALVKSIETVLIHVCLNIEILLICIRRRDSTLFGDTSPCRMLIKFIAD